MKRTLIVLSFTCWMLNTSCSRPGGGGAPAIIPAPSITAIHPLSGGQATHVSIKGEHFGSDPTKVAVSFNHRKAIIHTLTDSLLTTTVPDGAGSGAIEVTVSGKGVTGPYFIYTAGWQADTDHRSNPRPIAATVIIALAHSLDALSETVPGFFFNRRRKF
jgi:hypothetical protein